MSAPVRVLFVCLGNICRSPTAEGVFRHLVDQRGLAARFVIDSAGTSAYHIGEPPDERSTAAAQRRGIDLSSQRARQVTADDLDRFDYVLAMDGRNLAHLETLAAGRADGRAEVARFLSYRGTGPEDVPDPYYGGPRGFDEVLDLCQAGAEALLARILEADDAT